MICIADLLIDWQTESVDFVSDFTVDSTQKPVISVEFLSKMSECHSVQYTDKPSDHFLCAENGGFLLSNKDWSEVTSYFLPKSNMDFALPLAALCSRFSYYNALLVHSSLIDFQGNGILFTGYSGAGKTTQAELWAKFADAEIINGDKAFIREVEGDFFAYGLPWKGSSDYCLNKKVPLKGVVILRQSDANRIMRLSENALEYFMPHIFFPHWDKDCLDKSLNTFDRVLKKIPVWLLECRPDEDAVRITRDAVFW